MAEETVDPSGASMPPERWQKVYALFHEALDHPPGDRAAFLEETCPAPAIRRDVERLLEADAADSLLDTGREGLRLSVEAPSMKGRTIGPYRLEEEIGLGGMGVVYRATRTDVDRTVALKMLRERFPSTERVQRFLREQQLLGQLQHPGIAQFMDAGLTGDGTPYFVMEFVDGRPVTEVAADLPLPERLRLFADVCAAVQFAHRRLIVHRDLKPSNVLVTDDGTVKLLDFGIAKLLEDDAGLTRSGEHLLTPAYAAPEQATGDALSTATDVYALGVLLYEMLTGTRPIEVGDVPLQVAVERIREETPTAPSDRVHTTESLSPAALRGDLDTICLTALRKEPERRYESVAALRDDLQRYLFDRPITARPDTLTYRAGKFVRRNRTATFSSVGVLVMLAAILSFYTTRLADERDRATEQAELSESVTAFLVETLEEGDPNAMSGDTLTIFEVIDRAEQRAQELDDSPLVKANVLDAIGRVHFGNEDVAKAESLYYQSLKIRRATLSPTHPDIAASLNHLAQAKTLLGRFAEADSVLTESLSILKAVHGPSSPELVTPSRILGQIRYRQGQYESADSLFERVITIHESDSTIHPDSYADTYQKWGMVAHRQGRYDTARERYQRTIDLQNDRYPDGNTATASAYANLASLERVTGNYQQALEGYDASLKLIKKFRGERSISSVLIESNVAVTLQKLGDLDGAETLMKKNVRLREEIFGPDHPRTATAHHVLGRILAEQPDKGAEAERHFRRALALRQEAIPDQWQVGATQLELGGLLLRQSRYPEAEPLLIAGLVRMMDTRGSDHSTSNEGKRDLAELYQRWQRPERYAAVRDSLAEMGREIDAAAPTATAAAN